MLLLNWGHTINTKVLAQTSLQANIRMLLSPYLPPNIVLDSQFQKTRALLCGWVLLKAPGLPDFISSICPRTAQSSLGLHPSRALLSAFQGPRPLPGNLWLMLSHHYPLPTPSRKPSLAFQRIHRPSSLNNLNFLLSPATPNYLTFSTCPLVSEEEVGNFISSLASPVSCPSTGWL